MLHLTQIIGYIAMALLVLSFLQKKLRTIRLINLSACVFFIVYGIMLGWEWPIIISNALIAAVQVYHVFFVLRRGGSESSE